MEAEPVPMATSDAVQDRHVICHKDAAHEPHVLTEVRCSKINFVFVYFIFEFNKCLVQSYKLQFVVAVDWIPGTCII